MKWLVENISVIIGCVVLLLIITSFIYKFIMMGKDAQLEKVREWLLYAVTMAEKELGEQTGQLKLRMVYEQFVEKFKIISLLVSFEEFSVMVDDALENMRYMLETNKAVKSLVKGDE